MRIASYFTPDTTRRCESIIPLACHRADQRAACSQWARAAFKGLERQQPAYVGEDYNIKPRNELEMGTEACRLKIILGWAQIIKRRLCEKVVWPIGVL
jgi:hypothetical protein